MRWRERRSAFHRPRLTFYSTRHKNKAGFLGMFILFTLFTFHLFPPSRSLRSLAKEKRMFSSDGAREKLKFWLRLAQVAEQLALLAFVGVLKAGQQEVALRRRRAGTGAAWGGCKHRYILPVPACYISHKSLNRDAQRSVRWNSGKRV